MTRPDMSGVVRLGDGCCGGFHSSSVHLDEEFRWGYTPAVLVVPGYRIGLTPTAAEKVIRMLTEYLAAHAPESDEGQK